MKSYKESETVPSVQNSASNRNNNIGTLHLTAAVLVMLGHHYAISARPNSLLWGVPLHVIGVRSIFIISGYLITKSAWNIRGSGSKRFAVYFLKRCSRIYPELMACLLVTAFIIGPIFTELPIADYFSDMAILFRYIIANIRLYITYALPGVFVNNPYPFAVNGSLWTIPVEVALYFFVFLISLIPKYRKAVYTGVFLFFIVMFGVKFAIFPSSVKAIYGTDLFQTLTLVPFFLIGGMAYLYDLKRWLNVQLAALLLFLLSSISFQYQVITEYTCMVILSYFILSLMCSSEQHLSTKWMRSEYAYGMYLYGFVFQQCIVQKLSVEAVHPLGFWSTFLISLLCTYLAAALSYHVVYMPVNRMTKQLIARLEAGRNPLETK